MEADHVRRPAQRCDGPDVVLGEARLGTFQPPIVWRERRCGIQEPPQVGAQAVVVGQC